MDTKNDVMEWLDTLDYYEEEYGKDFLKNLNFEDLKDFAGVENVIDQLENGGFENKWQILLVAFQENVKALWISYLIRADREGFDCYGNEFADYEPYFKNDNVHLAKFKYFKEMNKTGTVDEMIDSLFKYNVTYLNDDGSQIYSECLYDDEDPSCKVSAKKESDGTSNYKFIKWIKSDSEVPGDVIFTAEYAAEPIAKKAVESPKATSPAVEKKAVESPKATSPAVEKKAVESLKISSPIEYTRFEKARIVGARALQISLGAPVLIDYPESMIDPVDIALLEYEEGMIPITVNRD